MRIFLLTLCLFFSALILKSQVTKKIVVEHFTNTRCSICASRNPGFYNNLATQPGVLHIAFHPSAPYAACLLNNYNVTENDARTNYYGVYGSTPRLVINGAVVATSADYSSPSIFAPYKSQTADFSILINQYRIGTDSIKIKIKIIKLNSISFSTATLFAGIFEDTIFYNAPNGETMHFDVFRNSYTGAQGTIVSLPQAIGDSIIYTRIIKLSNSLNNGRIYSLAILQNSSTKALLQAEKTPTLGKQNGTGIPLIQDKRACLEVYPNPATDKVILKYNGPDFKTVELYNSLGMLMNSYGFMNSLEIDLSALPSGIYFFRTNGDGISEEKKLVKI